MIEFNNSLIQEAIDDIDELSDGLEETTRRTGRYSIYKQIEQTVDEQVTTPILQRAKELGVEHVGHRVKYIESADGRWQGNTYTTGLTTDNKVVLAHEFGSGEHGRGNGKYFIFPGQGKDRLAFKINGRPIVTKFVVHPGVRARRFMRQAIREQQDKLAQEVQDDVQQTLQDATSQ